MSNINMRNFRAQGKRVRVDVRIENHNSLVLLRPMCKRAEEWLIEHTAEDAQWFGKALVVEPRFVDDILIGMDDAGLNVR